MKRALKYRLAVELCFVVVWTIKIVIKEKTDKTFIIGHALPGQATYSFISTHKTDSPPEYIESLTKTNLMSVRKWLFIKRIIFNFFKVKVP